MISLHVCNEISKILVMSTFGCAHIILKALKMHFVKEFMLCQIVIIIISTHVPSSDISLSCSPSVDEDGAEIRNTIENT